jgi:hypothetical protein
MTNRDNARRHSMWKGPALEPADKAPSGSAREACRLLLPLTPSRELIKR